MFDILCFVCKLLDSGNFCLENFCTVYIYILWSHTKFGIWLNKWSNLKLLELDWLDCRAERQDWKGGKYLIYVLKTENILSEPHFNL